MTDRTHPDSGFPIAYSHYATYAEYVEALHARIAELEAQLEAIGAGGVNGSLMGKPQAMPHWMQYDERTDVLTIHGKRYAAGMFGEDGFLSPPGTWLRVCVGAEDCVTLSRASLAASAGSEPVAIRPDIQAVLAMLDVPVIARMSSHEGKLLKPGQEPPAFESAVPLVREWDHRRACESIIAALSRNK